MDAVFEMGELVKLGREDEEYDDGKGIVGGEED